MRAGLLVTLTGTGQSAVAVDNAVMVPHRSLRVAVLCVAECGLFVCHVQYLRDSPTDGLRAGPERRLALHGL